MKKTSANMGLVVRRFSTFSCRLLLAVVLLSVAISSSAPIHAQSKPKSPVPITEPFSLGGERLPVAAMNEIEGDPRNEMWTEIAHLLRVRDLRVYQWLGVTDERVPRIKRRTIVQLKAAGFSVTEFNWKWNNPGYSATTGFHARRGKEVLSALWGGYRAGVRAEVYLYWGPSVPLTPARKRDDELIAAAIAGRNSEVENLLKAGANPQAVDYTGASVLYLAVVHRHAPIVKQLLAAVRPQSTITTSKDVTMAMKRASESNDLKTVQVFLDAGVTPRQIDEAFYVAATSVGTTKMAERLLPLASSEAVDRALVPAAYSGDGRGSSIQFPDIVKMLLERKPSQGALDAALMAASENDQARLVPVLLAAGADVETRDAEGQTVLLRAARWGRLHDLYMEKILEAGADPNARDNQGNTALILAVRGDHALYNTKLLLSHGANPNARNKRGASAMDWVLPLIAKYPASSREAMNYYQTARLLKATTETQAQPFSPK